MRYARYNLRYAVGKARPMGLPVATFMTTIINFLHYLSEIQVQ